MLSRGRESICGIIATEAIEKSVVSRAREAFFSSSQKRLGTNVGKSKRFACTRGEYFGKVPSRVHGSIVF